MLIRIPEEKIIFVEDVNEVLEPSLDKSSQREKRKTASKKRKTSFQVYLYIYIYILALTDICRVGNFPL